MNIIFSPVSRIYPYLARARLPNLMPTFVSRVRFEVMSRHCSDMTRNSMPTLRTEEKMEMEAPEVMNSLTKELAHKFKDGATVSMFKLKLIEEELSYLAQKKFPLPSSLTESQWGNLLTLKDRELRIKYLDCLVTVPNNEEEVLAKLKELNEIVTKGIEFSESMFLEFAKEGDDDLSMKVALISRAYNTMRQSGENIPLKVNKREMRELYSLKSLSAFTSYFRFLAKNRQLELADLIKKRIRSYLGGGVKEKINHERATESHIVYSLGQNCLFNRITDKAVEHWYLGNVAREFNHWGQPLVIDMQFLEQMSLKQVKSLMYRELSYGLNRNRKLQEPFPIYITSFDPTSDRCQLLMEFMPSIFYEDYPAVITEKHFTELFPNERLLYLTPDSREELMTYNDQDIYVIGGLIDGSNSTPVTLAEAKKQNIRHARLPLKHFIGMNHELNIDHMMAILGDFKHTQDWFYSFRWIPARFLRNRIFARGYNKKIDASHSAHTNLSPFKDNNEAFTPKEYRSKYAEIVANCLRNTGLKSYGERKFEKVIRRE